MSKVRDGVRDGIIFDDTFGMDGVPYDPIIAPNIPKWAALAQEVQKQVKVFWGLIIGSVG